MYGRNQHSIVKQVSSGGGGGGEFIATLFTRARTQKQPKCPLTDEWVKKMWYIYTMKYYSAIKRNKAGLFAEIWMALETVLQSELSQKEKHIIY